MPPVQIIGLQAAYFEKTPVMDPDGEQRINPDTNQKVFVTTRHTAKRREVVEVTDYEAQRLKSLGIARDPSSAPLPGDEPAPTPFGMPIKTDNDTDLYYTGPVMGDPTPGPQDEIGKTHGGLTPEEAARIEKEFELDPDNPAGGGEDDEFDLATASEEDTLAYLEERKPNVEDTLALALAKDDNGDPFPDEDGDLTYDQDLAEKILAAETARDKPRSGVVDPLTEVVDDDE